jgi:ferritin-like metal-binding protein YciE
MTVETMEDLFVSQVMDLYDAEQRLVKALPKMAEAAASPQLRQAFQSHLEETRGHVQRLERIFSNIGQKAKSTTCEAMKGLIEEGEEVISDIDDGSLRDAGLIAAANRVEHYEMAGYGSARTFAQSLGMNEEASLLEQTLEEEKKADARLTELATTGINDQAARTSQTSRR